MIQMYLQFLGHRALRESHPALQESQTADHKNWIEQHSKQDSYLIQRFYLHLLR